jgi:hypothetical protein
MGNVRDGRMREFELPKLEQGARVGPARVFPDSMGVLVAPVGDFQAQQLMRITFDQADSSSLTQLST